MIDWWRLYIFGKNLTELMLYHQMSPKCFCVCNIIISISPLHTYHISVTIFVSNAQHIQKSQEEKESVLYIHHCFYSFLCFFFLPNGVQDPCFYHFLSVSRPYVNHSSGVGRLATYIRFPFIWDCFVFPFIP